MADTPIQTHVSIHTADLPASIAFYGALLGTRPVLERHDYARFDVAEPAFVLGLDAVAPMAGRPHGPVEHLGLRFDGDAGLQAALARLRALALPLVEEAGSECCYARLDRAWAADPSGVRWELFVVREAVVEAASRAGGATGCCRPGCCATIEA